MSGKHYGSENGTCCTPEAAETCCGNEGWNGWQLVDWTEIEKRRAETEGAGRPPHSTHSCKLEEALKGSHAS